MNQVVDEEAMVRVVRSSSTAATAEHVSCGVLILAYITKLVFDHDVPRSQNLKVLHIEKELNRLGISSNPHKLSQLIN